MVVTAAQSSPAPLTLLENIDSILLYGDTGDGKTTLIGELAKWLYLNLGLRTILYSADHGGWRSINPIVKAGIILPCSMFGDPWHWLNHAVNGEYYENGTWSMIATEDWGTAHDIGAAGDIGLYAFDSATSIGAAMLADCRSQAARGVNLGGGGATNFNADYQAPGMDKPERMIIGSNNLTHFKMVQERLRDQIWLSQTLPAPTLWTAACKRQQDPTDLVMVTGPEVAGKALLSEMPGWFTYCFMVDSVPDTQGNQEHTLYMWTHKDALTAGAKALGNARIPFEGGTVKVEGKVKPASLVKALTNLARRQQAADEQVAREVAAANAARRS